MGATLRRLIHTHRSMWSQDNMFKHLYKYDTGATNLAGQIVRYLQMTPYYV